MTGSAGNDEPSAAEEAEEAAPAMGEGAEATIPLTDQSPESAGGSVPPEVVRRAVTGDDGAFAVLIEHHDSMLRELAHHLLQDPDETDGVLATSYLRAYRALPRLRPGVQPAPWLCRITYLACVDALRRRYRRRPRPGAPDERTARAGPAGEPGEPGETGHAEQVRSAFDEAFARLPADQRAAVLLADADRFDVPTVAEVIGRPEPEAVTLLERARAALSQPLAPAADAGETAPDVDRTSEEPDPQIAAALASLRERVVPDHREGFWPGLGERLIAEREAPAAPTFDPMARLEQGGLRGSGEARDDAASGAEDSGRDVGSGVGGDGEPPRPTIAHLAEVAERVNPRRANWRRRAFATACVVVVGTVIGVAVWLGATAKRASPTTTAGQVAQQMSRRLEGARYILGGVTTTEIGSGSGRYAFVRAADGSFRYRSLDRRRDTSYDARNGSGESWVQRPDGTIDASADRGLAPGPPDADGTSRYLRDDELGAIIRTLAASPAVLAKPRTSHGREVWVIDVALPTSSDAPIDNMRVVVDQQRRLPVEVSRSIRSGKVIQRKRFTDIRQASSVRSDTFQVVPPSGAAPAALDSKFRRLKLTAVRATVGYPAVTPKWLPRGYELTTVGVLAGSPIGLQSTAGGDNPPSRDVVSLAYRRGIEQVTVTQRKVISPSEHWEDPFLTAAKPGARVQRVRLDGGHYLGTTVEQVAAPGAASHLWGRTSNFVFTVAGDLDPSQLLRVANSLA